MTGTERFQAYRHLQALAIEDIKVEYTETTKGTAIVQKLEIRGMSTFALMSIQHIHPVEMMMTAKTDIMEAEFKRLIKRLSAELRAKEGKIVK